MPYELPDDVRAEHETDPLYVLGEFELERVVIEMMTRFGAETAETALLSRIFWFDPDFDLVWETQFEEDVDTPRDVAAQRALKWGLLVLFAPVHEWGEDENFDTFEHAFMRWQHVTRTLLRFQDAVEPDHPWLYGWAMFGVHLCRRVRSPRFELWDGRVARAVNPGTIAAQLGTIFADELPPSIDEFRALRGIGDATIKRVEQELVEMVLEPERYAPTLEEMGCTPL